MRVMLRVLLLVAGSAAALMAFTSASLKDARFDVTSVTLAGPATIANGGSANYTVTVNIRRTGASANQTIVGTSGPPPPRVRPSLRSGGTQLTFQEIDFAANQNTRTVTLTLSCSNNEVRGNVAGSGHGNPAVAQWWCLWLCSQADPAPIVGALNETESGRTNVLCTGG